MRLENKNITLWIKRMVMFVFMAFPVLSSATHIVGGSLTYVHNGGSSYTVTLKLYKDCGAGTAGFPGSAVIRVRGNNGATFTPTKDFTMNLGTVTSVSPNLDPCAVVPNPIPCVQEAVYTATVNNFPPNPGGYHMYYQIIARNLGILNVNNAVCNCIGESFYAFIPGAPAIWNEDFTMNDNITVDNGATAWSVSNGTTLVTSAMTNNNRFQFRGSNNGEATWASGIINITAYPTGVNLSVDLLEAGNFENSDSIIVYYKLNGGALTQFATNGFRINDFGAVTASHTGIVGATVQILVKVHYGGNSPNNERYRIDNVVVSGNATANLSNPEFNLIPPLFLCVGQPFIFDHSATDLDGDSLYYSFYTPYDGDNGAGPLDPTFPGNIATFTPIVWVPGFSAINPLGGAPLTLDPSTGLLSGTPTILGQFVVGIKVEEFRNGAYLSETLRDVQFNILNCPQPNPPFSGPDLTINDGCSGTLTATGFIPGTVTWTSVAPGAPGDYDNFLSCTTGCVGPIVTSVGAPPAFVDYVICGTAASCNNAFICDTVRVTFNPTLGVTIVPQNPTICFGQTSTTITANGSGGTPPYSYLWNNVNPSQSNVVGAGTFTVMCSDASGCPPISSTVTVVAYANPISTNAGPDDTLCIQNPVATLNGAVVGASGGVWTGGNGTYSPNNSTLVGMNYTPTATELTAGFVELILTSTGNGICPLGADTVRISFLGFIGNVITTPTNVSCFGGSDGTASVNITGGIAPFSYTWNTVPVQTGATATNLILGTYWVTIQNGIGCVTLDSVIITQPTPLGINLATTPVSCFGGNDGSVTVSAVGGTLPYGYVWSPGGQTTAVISGQLAGAYVVTVTDTNGCVLVGNDTIIEPTPLSATLTQTNVSCFGGSDGSATATIIGGTSPYTYSWSPSGGTSTNPSGLSAGTYILTITDFNSCTLIDSVIITEPLLPVTTTALITDVSCFSGSDGAITVTANGGTSPYTYLWSPGGQTTPLISGQVAGTYTYTVTDTNGCSFTDFTTIIEPSLLTVNTSQINVSCFGGNDAVASANVSGGTPGYSYLWTPGGATTATISNLTVGVYNVVVSDTNGCQGQDTVIITEPIILAVVLTPTPTACFGGSDGTVSSVASGGTGLYTYLWLPGGQTTDSILGQTAGVYTVTVTDSNGCAVTDNAIIVEPPTLSITFTNTSVSCYSGSDGAATVTVTGGISPYTYSWSPSGGVSPTASGLSAGTYVLTVTDANNCILTDSITITEPLLPVAAISSIINVSCFGGSDGSVIVTPSGGTSPYSYLWSPGAQTTATISGQIAGTYMVTITDANGCTTIDSAVVNEPTLPVISFNGQVNVSCFGGNDGAVAAIGSGGAPNYTYLWSLGGATTSTVSGLSVGTHILTLTDNNGCSVQDSVLITEPALLTVALTPTAASCFGASDGTVSSVASGGTGPFTYFWSPGGQTTASISGQSAGVYTVFITDLNGCTVTDNATIIDPTEIILSSGAVNSSCGFANGLAFVSISSGGLGPFTYLWSPSGGTNDTISGLVSGVYTVVVTDANGCIAIATGNVNDDAAPNASIISIIDVSCNGGSDGSVTVSALGGIGPYTYLWFPSGDTNATATGLMAGIHTVVVTGANGCQASATTNPIVAEPSAVATLVTVTNVSCFGGNDGGASAISVGGKPGHSYQWLPGGSTGTSVSNLTAGVDSVITTDTNGCVITTLFTIAEPIAPVSVVRSTTPVSCFGGSDGTVTALASGGISPYTYSWSPSGGVSPTASGLSIGTYIVTATDLNGCSIIDSITVTEPTQLVLTPSTVNSTCGLANGEASVVVVGGIAPYTYLWAPLGGTNATATGLLAGLYTVTVNDNNGCAQQANVTINDTPGPTATITATTNVSCFGGNDGTATVTPVGGTTPYTYLWSPIGGTGAVGTGLPTGTYTVVVTDSNGCQTNTTSQLITEPSPIVTTVTVTDVNCFGGNDGAASVTSIGGTLGYSYQWLPGGSTGTSVSNLTVGVDSVITTDANGCVLTTLFNIAEPTSVVLAITSITNVSCFGGSDGTATILVTGGTPFYSYSWSPSGGSGATAVGLSVGNYTVDVTDFNGCTTSIVVTIGEPAVTLSATANVTITSCFGVADGSATISPLGGTPGYGYLWSPVGGTGQTATGLLSGNYTVLVSDTNGCQTNVALSIVQPPALVGILDTINPACGLSNGSALAMVSGGTTPYTYLWTPGGSATQNITGLAPGPYSVDVIDDSGCLLTLTANLVDIPGPTVSIPTFSNVSCYGGNDGSATATIVGGSAPYSINWTPYGGNAITASSLIAGTYYVDVTDSLGCIASDSVVISEPSPLSITVDSVMNVSCSGGNDGTITIIASGGSGTYSYSWSPNISSSPSVSGLPVGTYVVTVSDINGCSMAISINVSEPQQVLTSSILSITNPSCFTSTNGSATVNVTGGTVPYSYLWSNLQTGSTANNFTGGTYNVSITDINGCVVMDSAIIVQPGQVFTTAGENDTICLGQSGVVMATATGGAGNFSFNWQPAGVTNAGTLNITPTVNTQYSVMAFDQNGCPGNVDTVSAIVLSLDPSNIEAMITVPIICVGQTTQISVQQTGVQDSLTYIWNNGVGIGAGPFTVSPFQSTTYVVTATNSCGVSVLDSVTVNMSPPPTLLFGSDINSSCGSTTIQFTDSSITGYAPDQLHFWFWNFGDGNTSQVQNPVHTYTQPGTYQVGLTVTTGNGCTSTNSGFPYTITIFPTPTAAFSVNSQDLYLPNDVLITDNTSIGATLFNWNFDDGYTTNIFEPQYLYSTIGSYQIQLIATNSDGCSDTAVIDVTTNTDLVMPNAFTPNSGGSSGGYYDIASLNNDIFFPYTSGVVEYKFEIFNRWGELIFYTTDFKQGWDGYYKGELVQQDIYIWKMYVKLNNDKTFNRTGDVTLLR